MTCPSPICHTRNSMNTVSGKLASLGIKSVSSVLKARMEWIPTSKTTLNQTNMD